MGKIETSSGSVSVIGGSDGPTSIFLAGKRKKTIRQRVEKRLFQLRKTWFSLGIRPNAHSMDEVIKYIKEKYGFEEIEKDSREYLTQYDSLRTSFIMQYEPELLGEYAEPPVMESQDEEVLKEFMKQLAIREQKVREIPEDAFTLDFHILKNAESENSMYFQLESRFKYIGGGFSGPKKSMRRYQKIYKDVHRYYGVTEEDIANKTKRYKELLTALAIRN